jgi:predicted GNAT family N-acyltransferase
MPACARDASYALTDDPGTTRRESWRCEAPVMFGMSRHTAAFRAPYDGAVEVVELGRLSDAQHAQLEGDEVDPFGAAGNTLRWRAKDRHVALCGPDGRLVASAGLLLTEVRVDDGPAIAVVGIGGVIVAAPYRGQRLADRVIVQALRLAATLGPAIALLFCHRDRAGLYARHRFAEIKPPVYVKQPGGFEEVPQVAMWRALRAGATLPSGRVVLHSLPF